MDLKVILEGQHRVNSPTLPTLVVEIPPPCGGQNDRFPTHPPTLAVKMTISTLTHLGQKSGCSAVFPAAV